MSGIIRDRRSVARAWETKRAAMSSYPGAEVAAGLLDAAPLAEIVCVPRHERCSFVVHGSRLRRTPGELRERAEGAQGRADGSAERIASAACRPMMTSTVGRDPTTCRLFEPVLAQEEEHAENLVALLEDLPKD